MDELERFCERWLAVRSFLPPEGGGLTYDKDTHGVVLYREGQFQVELFSVRPESVIVQHVHPNVDSFEVYVSGDIAFVLDGEWYRDMSVGDVLRVHPSSWHGGEFGARGGCFLSIQHWLNGVSPKFVGDDWEAKDGSPAYRASGDQIGGV